LFLRPPTLGYFFHLPTLLNVVQCLDFVLLIVIEGSAAFYAGARGYPRDFLSFLFFSFYSQA